MNVQMKNPWQIGRAIFRQTTHPKLTARNEGKRGHDKARDLHIRALQGARALDIPVLRSAKQKRALNSPSKGTTLSMSSRPLVLRGKCNCGHALAVNLPTTFPGSYLPLLGPIMASEQHPFAVRCKTRSRHMPLGNAPSKRIIINAPR